MRLPACRFLLAVSICRAPASGGSFVRAPLEDVGISFSFVAAVLRPRFVVSYIVPTTGLSP